MFGLDESGRGRFRDAVNGASRRADVRVAIHAVYQHLQDAIDLRKPICDASGRCCRFDEYGHRLYVTTMEMGVFVAEASRPMSAGNTGGCVFQHDRLCSVHSIRPFGCRVFFCDPSATDWQRRQYERVLGHLKRLHDELEIPYFYLEWRQALRAVGFDAMAGASTPVDAASSALTGKLEG